MKKLLLIAFAAAALAGCSKGVQCKCTATTATDHQGRPLITYVDVDWDFSCKNITKVLLFVILIMVQDTRGGVFYESD